MVVSNQEKGLVCICRANDSELLKCCLLPWECLQITSIVTQMSKGCALALNTDFCLQVDGTKEITVFSLETPASVLTCVADSSN